VVSKNSNFVVEYCGFIHKTFFRFNFIKYGRQALSYVLVQATINSSLVRVKLLQATPLKYTTDTWTVPDLYSCLCERSFSLRLLL